MFLIRHLKLRWKLLVMIVPLVLVPMILSTIIIGFVAIKQIYQEVAKANKADLEHMSVFTLDLLAGYHQQREFSRKKMQAERRHKLGDLTELAFRLVESQYLQFEDGIMSEEQAKGYAYRSLKDMGVGEFGYIYVMNSAGDLIVHVDREGENILAAVDERGRPFIREICENALQSEAGETLFITYPWSNSSNDYQLQEKEVAYRYFRMWDWIIAAGMYRVDEMGRQAIPMETFADLRERVTGKPVDRPGHIYAMDCSSRLVLHADREGENMYRHFDSSGRALISKLCRGEVSTGWLHYRPHFDREDGRGRRFARLTYFPPYHWIVVVEMAEEELVRPAKAIAGRITLAIFFMLLLVGTIGGLLAFLVAKLFTDPIQTMTAAMRRVKSGHLEERLEVATDDELGEMASAFNQMSEMLERDFALQKKLTNQQKMASLGVFSAEVAHEINNPMGIILGYACHLESKMDPDDPRYYYVTEIRRESKRCVTILKDLLNYARPPEPRFQATDLAHFLDQIIDFAGGHKELKNVVIRKTSDEQLPEIMVDRDQIRQVVMNLVLNGAAAMEDGGEIIIRLGIHSGATVMLTFQDSGVGISRENIQKVFEPFYSTRRHGTGLGLAISKQLVEAHLGSIDISSTPGKGTTVYVYLPIKQDGYNGHA
ncbi:MAG: cache domain-containing protein [Desulfocapsaceae bacterium]|jgi:two-component system NtrC family sensor kinase|nr:cache domain-containing protein [Desulfocapsaceae bacterium]